MPNHPHHHSIEHHRQPSVSYSRHMAQMLTIITVLLLGAGGLTGSFFVGTQQQTPQILVQTAGGDGKPGGLCVANQGGADSRGCGGTDGCRSWEKCTNGTCIDTTNGGKNSAASDSCGSSSGSNTGGGNTTGGGNNTGGSNTSTGSQAGGFHLEAVVNPKNDKNLNEGCNVDIKYVADPKNGNAGCDGDVQLYDGSGKMLAFNGWNNQGGTAVRTIGPNYTGSPYPQGSTAKFKAVIVATHGLPSCVGQTSTINVTMPNGCGKSTSGGGGTGNACVAAGNSCSDGQTCFDLGGTTTADAGCANGYVCCKASGSSGGGGNNGSGGNSSGSCGNSCTQCILKNVDLLTQYKKDGWDTSCSNQDKVVDNWCGRAATNQFGNADPSQQQCKDLKGGTCKDACTNITNGGGGGGAGGSTGNGAVSCFHLEGKTSAVTGDATKCNVNLTLTSDDGSATTYKVDYDGTVIFDGLKWTPSKKGDAYSFSNSTTYDVDKSYSFTAAATASDDAACKSASSTIKIDVKKGCSDTYTSPTNKTGDSSAGGGGAAGSGGADDTTKGSGKDAKPLISCTSDDKNTRRCTTYAACKGNNYKQVGEPGKLDCDAGFVCCELSFSLEKDPSKSVCELKADSNAKKGYYSGGGKCFLCHGGIIKTGIGGEYGKEVVQNFCNQNTFCADKKHEKYFWDTSGAGTCYYCHGKMYGSSYGYPISSPTGKEKDQCDEAKKLTTSSASQGTFLDTLRCANAKDALDCIASWWEYVKSGGESPGVMSINH